LSGIHRLEQVHRLPLGIVLILIDFFKHPQLRNSTTCLLTLRMHGRDVDHMLMIGNRHLVPSSTYSHQDIILLTVNKHQLLCTKGTWNGVSTKGNDSVFIQKQSWAKQPPIFWNYGGQHTLTECTRDRNFARIEGKSPFTMASKRERKKSLTRIGDHDNGNYGVVDWKTQHPKNDKLKTKERDGKHWFYQPRDNKWVLDRDHYSSGTTSPPVPSATPAIEPAPLTDTPAANSADGTILPEQMTNASLGSLFRERELSIATQDAMANLLAAFE
jgi:hypothetical protein